MKQFTEKFIWSVMLVVTMVDKDCEHAKRPEAPQKNKIGQKQIKDGTNTYCPEFFYLFYP